MCDILYRDDSHLKHFDKDMKEHIIDVRNQAECLIKELSEFLHHERPMSHLKETLESELEKVNVMSWLNKVTTG